MGLYYSSIPPLPVPKVIKRMQSSMAKHFLNPFVYNSPSRGNNMTKYGYINVL